MSCERVMPTISMVLELFSIQTGGYMKSDKIAWDESIHMPKSASPCEEI